MTQDQLVQIYKSNWPEARERLCKWWAGERIDRAVALVRARAGVQRRPTHDGVPAKYTDTPTVLANIAADLEATYYGAEAIPLHWIYLGPIPFSGYMGCGMHFTSDTVWHSSRFTSWDVLDELRFDPENQWFKLLRHLTLASLDQAQGRYWVNGQGVGYVLDVIADLWGAENMLVAMAEQPAKVRAIVDRLTDIALDLHDQIETWTAGRQDGTADCLQLWAPGPLWSMQCDVSCMISPEMFEEFVAPELGREAAHVPYSLYHLDGPGALKHVPSLLRIPELHAIQWVPGDGASWDPLTWVDLFKQIQAAGKKAYIFCPPERIRSLLGKISPQGVCLCMGCKDQATADAAILELDRIGG